MVDSSDQLVRCLSGRDGVLVLDNCEHARGPVAAICERAAGLGLRGAHPRHEPGAARCARRSPRPGATSRDTDGYQPGRDRDCRRGPTVRRAGAELSPRLLASGRRTAPRSLDLCRSLDGLPLALELAAARITTLTPEEMLSRLDQLFNVVGQRSDHVDHHRTLRATLDWSYDLLDADEQVVLSQLAMFAPGFTVEAVEAVTAGMPVHGFVLDVLAGLVAKSMVDRRGRQRGHPHAPARDRAGLWPREGRRVPLRGRSE